MNAHFAIFGTRVRRGAWFALALLFLTAPGLAWAAPSVDPTGEWLVAKGVARIRIVNCDERLWGVVSWELQPGIDRNNPDPNERTRPTLGMAVLLGMTATEPNRWEGEIYNSENGKTYSANIKLLSPDVLRVEGCILGFLCGGENWTRVTPETTPGASAPPPSPNLPGNRAPSPNDVCSGLLGPPGFSHERGLK